MNLKLVLIAVTILWIVGGFFGVKNWNKMFGEPNEDPTESEGARSYGTAHIISIYTIKVKSCRTVKACYLRLFLKKYL